MVIIGGNQPWIPKFFDLLLLPPPSSFLITLPPRPFTETDITLYRRLVHSYPIVPFVLIESSLVCLQFSIVVRNFFLLQ